jgi:hypothetical protein
MLFQTKPGIESEMLTLMVGQRQKHADAGDVRVQWTKVSLDPTDFLFEDTMPETGFKFPLS